jgi:Cep192 domain 4
MAEPFTITTTTGSIQLDGRRQGSVAFSVTNVSGRPLHGRARPVPDGGADASWFTVADGSGEAVPDGGTLQYVVQIAAPLTAPAGTSRFRLDVLGTEDPDELQAHGQWVAVIVPPVAKTRVIPWPWIIAAAAAVVVLAVVGGLVFFLTHRSGTLSPSPAAATFGTLTIGASKAQNVTVKNTGPAATMVTAKITGREANQFKIQSNGCGSKKLESNASCVVAVQFTPTKVGSLSAALELDGDNAGSESVGLTGTGRGVPAATVAPSPLVLHVVGGAPPFVVVAQGVARLSNPGTGDLHVTGAAVQATGYTVNLPDGCAGRTLAPKASCDVTVRLTGQFGLPPGQLVIKDDAPGGQQAVALLVIQ